MCRLHVAQLGEVTRQGGHAPGGRTLDEFLGHRPQRDERLLGRGLGPHRPGGHGPRPSVVVVAHSRLTRGDEVVTGDDLAQEDGGHRAVRHHQLDLAADVGRRHRVAGRAEPDTAEPVDLAEDDLADPGPERRQVAEQFTLDQQPFGGDGTDLGVHLGVDLCTPRHSLGVGVSEVGHAQLLGDHEVGLHVADQVLDDALGLGVGPLAEVRPRSEVGDEAHVVGSGDDEPGHRCALQAPHAVGEEGPRHSADRLHALGERGHGRLGSKVVGEVHEAEPAPGQHRAEDEQGTDLPPVEHQHVARCPHARPASPMVADTPRRLGLGHRPAQIAG